MVSEAYSASAVLVYTVNLTSGAICFIHAPLIITLLVQLLLLLCVL